MVVKWKRIERGIKMREDEFKKIKEIIKEWFEYRNCRLFNSRNLMGDYMSTLFKGEYFI